MTLNDLMRALILNDKGLLSIIPSQSTAPSHTHSNIDLLNLLSADSSGKLLYNGSAVSQPSHSHSNKNILDLLSVNADGKLLYNGAIVGQDTINVELTDAQMETIVKRIVNIVNGKDALVREIYGFYVYGDPDPYASITPITDSYRNKNPVFVNLSKGNFFPEDWGDAFFMKVKPVMLYYDGTVAYELDKNDYSKKKNGDNSDVANLNFPGNAMVGIPTVWINVDYYDDIYIANYQVNEDYHAYAHTDEYGNILKYIYMPIYDGFIDSEGRLRSISGVTPTSNTLLSTDLEAAAKNNISGDHMWNITTESECTLMYTLLTCIARNTNLQQIFGYGNCNSNAINKTGTLDQKGLFYGLSDKSSSVKVFGMENFWSNKWKRVIGSIYKNGTYYVKATYGTQDGSSGVGYNLTGDGYLKPLGVAGSDYFQIRGTSMQYISGMTIRPWGWCPTYVGGKYQDEYFCDACVFTNSKNNVPYYKLHGGSYYGDTLLGPYAMTFSADETYCHMDTGSSLSCKPGVKENILIPAP